jgi:hypothetical protein
MASPARANVSNSRNVDRNGKFSKPAGKNVGGFFVLEQPRNKVTKPEKTLFLCSFVVQLF